MGNDADFTKRINGLFKSRGHAGPVTAKIVTKRVRALVRDYATALPGVVVDIEGAGTWGGLELWASRIEDPVQENPYVAYLSMQICLGVPKDDARAAPRTTICNFCWRRGQEYRLRQRPINPKFPTYITACGQHAPGKPGGRRVAHIARWAGGHGALREMVLDEAADLRKRMSDDGLEFGLSVAPLEEYISLTALNDWALTNIDKIVGQGFGDGRKKHELAIRIIAWHKVEDRYRHALRHLRRKNGQAGGIKGGRPQSIPRRGLARAAAAVKKDSSVRAAAKTYGVNEATLRRYIKSRML